jgi:outer membrane lipoprotein SlyB
MTIHGTKMLMSALAGVTIMLAGCSGGSSGSGSSSESGSGQISLGVSDAPVQDARQVCIEFTEAEFKKAGSDNQVFVFDPPEKVDLLAYQGMNAAPLLTNETLEAGEYQWVRLAANAAKGANGGAGAGMNDTECVGDGSYIVTESGAVHGLYIPSSAESGLKLNRGFTLPVGGNADFIAEFDLMKSTHAPNGLDPDYIMRPTIRLLDRTETGSIAGEVSALLATQSDCKPAVYLYNVGESPDDNEDDGDLDSIDPIASAMVSMQNDGRYLYEIGPVLAGMYDVLFSCDPDDPDADEVLNYELSADNPVEVLANQQASANF